MSMKELEGTELVLRITGAVEQSNLKEFETQALEVIAGINTTLETDEDFSTAEANIKACQTMENRIATARNTALANTAEIAELIATTQRLEAKFRDTRLNLNGKVKTEKQRRVNEIVNHATLTLDSLLKISSARHGFAIDRTAITNAVKGKKSLAKMQEAVDAVVDAEEKRLMEIETNFIRNLERINQSESEWPGLFPDKQNVALSAPETVEAMITGRVSDHRFKMAEKARKEQEEKERKERVEAELKAAAEAKEAARIAKELEEYVEAEAVKIDAENNPFLAEPAPVVEPPVPVEIPIPVPFHDFPIPPKVSVSLYTLIVEVETDDIGKTMDDFRGSQGVVSVNIEF